MHVCVCEIFCLPERGTRWNENKHKNTSWLSVCNVIICKWADCTHARTHAKNSRTKQWFGFVFFFHESFSVNVERRWTNERHGRRPPTEADFSRKSRSFAHAHAHAPPSGETDQPTDATNWRPRNICLRFGRSRFALGFTWFGLGLARFRLGLVSFSLGLGLARFRLGLATFSLG